LDSNAQEKSQLLPLIFSSFLLPRYLAKAYHKLYLSVMQWVLKPFLKAVPQEQVEVILNYFILHTQLY